MKYDKKVVIKKEKLYNEKYYTIMNLIGLIILLMGFAIAIFEIVYFRGMGFMAVISFFLAFIVFYAKNGPPFRLYVVDDYECVDYSEEE